MNRSIFPAVVCLGVCLTAWVAVASETRPPNIVLIMADDIGVECLGCYGSEVYETPHLDALAASGMRFEQAHAQPLCTPSRVQIMTGKYNNRNYIRFGLLDPEAVTFAHLLRNAGYRTCIAGKWQLEGGFEGPGHFGFQRYCLWQLTRRPSRYPNPGLEIDGREKDFKEGQFGPDLVTDYICDFMEANRQRPFLVYYPMILPHWPFVPTPDHPDWDPAMWRDAKGEPGGFRGPKYWDAMVRYTDKMVGKVVAKLDALGIRENTLVIWTADNGTYTGITSLFRGRQYQGGKGSTTDSGTHVGFIASWPGTIAAGSVSDSLVDFADVLPTLAEVAGADVPGDLHIDGVSLGPLFRGKPREKDHIYCWYHRNGVREEASQHVRTARHKLYADGRFLDVEADPGEQTDLATGLIPAESKPVYDRLREALARHMEVTRAADARQNAKRALYQR
ncbi:MAG: sulfatase-like hydrolase/transferase [Thermoguttaceae bacterium]|jgi:arylsulfatase A|nr:sulfatase-like hydrolase/transferase [Thermoguttaceae bacterium]